MQNDSEVLSGLVFGHLRDGRCRYDRQVKQELVRRCLQPGVSVARMAMQHGVNANLLRKWITQRQSRNAIAVQAVAPQGSSAFVAVQFSGAPNGGKAVPPKVPAAPNYAVAQPMHLRVELPNGVAVDLGATEMQDLLAVMQTLCSLPCSR
ncbi:IS66-like element accessory protein TnpA [Rhodoferax sp.]|uniref:IS66-like element accessory protein TnpA n=1 Tax=Rhodoferax sp. TaxID=50421 RepID=UPI00374D87E3